MKVDVGKIAQATRDIRHAIIARKVKKMNKKLEKIELEQEKKDERVKGENK